MTDENNPNIQEDNKPKSAGSKSGSAFSGLSESLQSGNTNASHNKSPKSNAKAKVGSAAMQAAGIPKPIANMAANRLANRKGKSENVPEALKKHNNGMPNFKGNSNNGGQNQNESSATAKNAPMGGLANGLAGALGESNQKSNSEEKGAVQKTAEKAVEKGGSAAMQAAGIPKPVADIVAKKTSGPALKIALIGAIGGFLMWLILIICSFYILFLPLFKGIQMINGLKDDVGDFFSSTINWFSGKGWCSNDPECVLTAEQNFYERAKKLSGQYTDVDMSIVMSSVLYGVNKGMFSGYCDSSNYEDCNNEDDKQIEGWNEAESNLKKIAKKLQGKDGKAEYEEYMLNDYIPDHYSDIMKSSHLSAEQVLQEIYQMASMFDEYKNPYVGSYAYISNICPNGITVNAGSDSNRFPGAVNLSLEEYVAGSLASEYSGANASASEDEVMKTMAVFIRSMFVSRVISSGEGACVVDNTTNFQTYREPTERTTRIAEETAGEVLMLGDKVIGGHYSIFPGKNADGWGSVTCENSVCNGGMCTATLFKDPNNERAVFTIPQTFRGYSDVSNISNSHCHGMSTLVASYYAESQNLSYQQIAALFISGDVTISQMIGGEQRFPLDLDDYVNWRNYTSRVYQIGTATCYQNGQAVGTGCSHLAVDFAYGGINGKNVYAFADGNVIDSLCSGSYGCHVKLGHDIDGDGEYDYYSIYAHMQNDSLSVKSGEVISAGTPLGLVGSTGNSTGPHLHFEIYSSAGRTAEDYYNTRPDLMLDRIARGEKWYEKNS